MEIRVDGVRIGYRTWGDPDSPPLVLMHSTSFGAWMWEPVASLLDDHFYIVATDQPGHGDSDCPPDDRWEFDHFAACLKQALDQLGVGSAVGAGHSSGATTLLLCEAAYPGTFSSLLLIEPIIPPAGAQPGFGSNPMADGARRRRPSFDSAEAMYETFRHRPPFSTWTEEALRLYAEQGTRPSEAGVLLKCEPESEARFYEAIGNIDVDRLSSVQCPTRLVRGEHSDTVRRGMFERAREILPGARVETVAQAGHFIPQEQPSTIARLIRELAAGG